MYAIVSYEDNFSLRVYKETQTLTDIGHGVYPRIENVSPIYASPKLPYRVDLSAELIILCDLEYLQKLQLNIFGFLTEHNLPDGTGD